MHLLFLVIIGIFTSVSDALPNIEFKSNFTLQEICKSDNGYMTLSDQTKILAKFKNENGLNVIIVDENNEKGLNEEFTFTCHRYNEKNQTKIIFKSEESNDILGTESPSSRKLRNYDLTINDIATSTEPFSVKCEAVCEVTFIVVDFEADSLCDENDFWNWNCGIDRLKLELAPIVFLMSNNHEESLMRKYQIKNPFNEQPSFYDCYDIDRNDSYLGIKSCVYVLEQLDFDPNFSPYKILIKMVENGEVSYITKLYYPSIIEKAEIPIWVKFLCVIFLLFIMLITGCLCYYVKNRTKDKSGFKKLVRTISITEDLNTIQTNTAA